jgi:hypothetical protein
MCGHSFTPERTKTARLEENAWSTHQSPFDQPFYRGTFVVEVFA